MERAIWVCTRPLTIQKQLTRKPRYIWFGSNVILFVFTFFYVPETRDRTLEEIHEMFQAKLPARKFKGYVCTGTAAMHTVGVAKGPEVQELEDASRASQAGETDKGSATAKDVQV